MFTLKHLLTIQEALSRSAVAFDAIDEAKSLRDTLQQEISDAELRENAVNAAKGAPLRVARVRAEAEPA